MGSFAGGRASKRGVDYHRFAADVAGCGDLECPGDMIRLLSYNIHKGIGGRDRRYDLSRVLDVIDSEQPDIICLQEVTWRARRTLYHDQPELIARRFDPRGFHFQLNVRYRNRGGYGNLLLSRWSFVESHPICLRLGQRKPRGAQLAVVAVPGGRLHIAHGHLGLRERERHWQVDRLLRHERFLAAAELPTLVVGDFNDWRDTLADGIFARHTFQHATGPSRRFRSFPAFMPLLSLDKAFHRGLDVHHVRLVRTPLARQASDHLPLIVDFRLPK